MKTVVFLQNPWSAKYAGQVWPRRSWKREFDRSRAGKRLSVVMHGVEQVHYDNANWSVGQTSDVAFPPDLDHIAGVLKAKKPGLVVGCGKLAGTALSKLWSGKLLVIPHPCFRLLSNQHLDLINQAIKSGSFHRQSAKTVDRETLQWSKLDT